MSTMITITGADNEVAPQHMIQLSKQFRFVEWGILVGSNDRFGMPRYPTFDWIQRLLWERSKTMPGMRLSLHLCGAMAREFIAHHRPHTCDLGKSGFTTTGMFLWNQFDRVQVNGWNMDTHMDAMGCGTPDVIVQCREPELVDQCVERAWQSNVWSVLVDASGGRGEPIKSFPKSQARWLGYAGGIGPHNVRDSLRKAFIASRDNAKPLRCQTGMLASEVEFSPFWLDMETGVRTDDKLDMEKVIAVLSQTQQWRTAMWKERPTCQRCLKQEPEGGPSSMTDRHGYLCSPCSEAKYLRSPSESNSSGPSNGPRSTSP